MPTQLELLSLRDQYMTVFCPNYLQVGAGRGSGRLMPPRSRSQTSLSLADGPLSSREYGGLAQPVSHHL